MVGIVGELLLQALQRHAVCAGQVKLRRRVSLRQRRAERCVSGLRVQRASPSVKSSVGGASSMAAAPPQPGASRRGWPLATRRSWRGDRMALRPIPSRCVRARPLAC